MRTAVLVAGLAVLTGCGGRDRDAGSGGGDGPAPSPRATGAARPTGAREVPAGPVSLPAAKRVGLPQAGNLWLAYRDNAAAADGKYTGKYVVTGGQVHSVSRDGADYLLNFNLYLDQRQDVPPALVCRFPESERDELAKVKPGTTAMVNGRCLGRRATARAKGFEGHVVVLEDCRLEPPAKK